jgi:hypothetical protein
MQESTTEGPEWQRPVKNEQAKEEKKGLKKKVKSQDRTRSKVEKEFKCPF